MAKILSLFLLLILLPATLGAQGLNADDARKLADEATLMAREGKHGDALRLYKQALSMAPEDKTILRDYAIVLGWNEQYKEALPIIRTLLTTESQPDWALRDFAQAFLFGDATQEALQCLDQLVERGDYGEQTLSRRALALRWLARLDDAEVAYQEMLRRYPQSAAAYTGLAYTAADRNQLSEALRILDRAPNSVQNDRDILVSRIQILNWMGRHYEAQRLISKLPPELAENRDILRQRVAAARWGGDPSGALNDTRRLVSLYPDKASRDLLGQLGLEYGHTIAPGFRYTQDSQGQIDRTTSSDFVFHLNPAHALRVGYQYRWQQQNHEQRTLVRYDLGWSADLSNRVSVWTSLSNVDYRTLGLPRKMAGDVSVSIAVSDVLRVGGGGGVLINDAFQSIPTQVNAPFGFAEVGLNFGRNRVHSRYSRYSFSDNIERTRLDAQFMRPIFVESAVRLNVGFRSSLMTHSDWTPDFYSPSRLQSYFGVAQFSGGLTSWMDYSGELAAGWQAEKDSPLMHPFQMSGGISWHPSSHWRLTVDASKSTASMDRIGPGVQTYSRWGASVGFEVRMR